MLFQIQLIGSEGFIENLKSLMRGLAIGRKGMETGASYQLREPAAPYLTHFGSKKDDMGPENTYLWDINL